MTDAAVSFQRIGNANSAQSLMAPLLYSVLAHLLLIALFSLHLKWWKKEDAQPPLGPVMNAQLVDLRPPPRSTAPVVPAVQEPAPEQTPDIQPEPVQDDTAAKAEQAEIEKQLAEQKAAAQARENAERAANEEKINALALEAKKKKEQEEKASLEKQRKEKLEAERRQKLEDEKKAKELAEQKANDDQRKKAEAEAKRKAEQEKQRKAEQARRQQAEDELAQQMEDEAAQFSARRKAVKSEIDEYYRLIYNKIARNWIFPSNPVGTCKLKIKLGPGGIVLYVSEGVGDPVLCRSAVVAVRKAEPLPVSRDPEVFQEIRDINLTMDPTKSVF